MWQRLLSLFVVCLFMNCAGSQRAADSALSAPSLSVRLFATGTVSPSARELHPGDKVRAAEQVELQVVTQIPAHVYAVLYAPAGESDLLYGGGAQRLVAPGEVVRIGVARPIPPPIGDPVQDVRLFVLASATPLGSALSSQLRLPCPLHRPSSGSRDDGKKKDDNKAVDDGKKKDDNKGEKGTSTGGRKAPAEQGKKDRGDECEAVTVCAAPPGVHAPSTIVPIVVKYE